MIIDTSALFAILADEPERCRFVELIEAACAEAEPTQTDGTAMLSAATA